LVFFVVDAWLKIFQRTILGARLDGRQPAPAASLELRRRLVDLNQSLPTEIRQSYLSKLKHGRKLMMRLMVLLRLP
jgi:hypothetical protein